MTVARTMTQALRGKWYGSYGVGFCPAHHDGRTPALSLADGDDGRLLAHCFAGCGFRDVLAALRGLGLVEGGGAYVAPDPAADVRRRAAAATEAAKRSAQAKAVWAEAQPIQGTPAETYLRPGHHLRDAGSSALRAVVLARERQAAPRARGLGRGRRRLCGASDLPPPGWRG